jgi:hypothetical protein
MPTVEAIIQYGSILPGATATFLDEPSLLVESLAIKPNRDKKAFKGPNRATVALSYTDPTISFAFKAIISEAAGLAIQHPGTLVTDLANFAGTTHGFVSGEGIMVYEDPSTDLSNDNPDMVNFTVVNYPFVEESP